eukprot:gene7734-9064_t
MSSSPTLIDPVIGILQINVHEARDLPPMDANGKADPYFEIIFAGEKVFKSSTIKKTLCPVWNETYNLLVTQSTANYTLQLKIWDWDKLTQNVVDDQWHKITKEKKDGTKDRGELHVSMRMIGEKEVSSAFWTSITRHFSHMEDDSLSFADYTALITSVNPDFPEPDIKLLFESADLNKDGAISVSELESFFNQTKAGEELGHQLLAPTNNPNLVWEAYAISDSYSTIADTVFSKNLGGTLKSAPNGQKVKVILVHNRETGKLEEEKIPHYIEVSIRVMYSTSGGRHAVENAQVKRLLRYLTVKTGKKYQSPESIKDIAPFIKFHDLNVNEILDPLSTFHNFNEFFYRKLKPSARPIFDLNNSKTAVSPADCRLNVFPTIEIAQELWIKGKSFTLASLLQDEQLAAQYEGGAIAIARLAPQDYHRFHIPVDGTIRSTKSIDGALFTVNPIAIRENIDVYCENKRAVTLIDSVSFGTVVFVSVGATMVGSINLTTTEGQQVKKGDEQGYFAFGGSTILLLFKKNTIEFDQDLVINSSKPIETLVKVGTSLGKSLFIIGEYLLSFYTLLKQGLDCSKWVERIKEANGILKLYSDPLSLELTLDIDEEDILSHNTVDGDRLLNTYSIAELTGYFERFNIRPMLEKRGYSKLKVIPDYSDPWVHRIIVTDESIESAKGADGLLLDIFLRRKDIYISEILHERARSPSTGGSSQAVVGSESIRGEILRHLPQYDVEGNLYHWHCDDTSDHIMENYFKFPIKATIIEWFSLHDPKRDFSSERPPLPGQQYPGLGIAKNMDDLIVHCAVKSGRDCLLNTPYRFYNAFMYQTREYFFIDPSVQAYFLSLLSDMEPIIAELGLAPVSWAFEFGCVKEVTTGHRIKWEFHKQIRPLSQRMKSYFKGTDYTSFVKRNTKKGAFYIDWNGHPSLSHFHSPISSHSLPTK